MGQISKPDPRREPRYKQWRQPLRDEFAKLTGEGKVLDKQAADHIKNMKEEEEEDRRRGRNSGEIGKTWSESFKE